MIQARVFLNLLGLICVMLAMVLLAVGRVGSAAVLSMFALYIQLNLVEMAVRYRDDGSLR